MKNRKIDSREIGRRILIEIRFYCEKKMYKENKAEIDYILYDKNLLGSFKKVLLRETLNAMGADSPKKFDPSPIITEFCSINKFEESKKIILKLHEKILRFGIRKISPAERKIGVRDI